MNGRAFLMVMVAGLFLTVGTSGMAQKPALPAAEETYVRVELKGVLLPRGLTGIRDVPVVQAGKDQFELDLSDQKELKSDEAWRKLRGKALLVTGTLTLPRNTSEMATVYVSTLRVLGE